MEVFWIAFQTLLQEDDFPSSRVGFDSVTDGSGDIA